MLSTTITERQKYIADIQWKKEKDPGAGKEPTQATYKKSVRQKWWSYMT